MRRTGWIVEERSGSSLGNSIVSDNETNLYPRTVSAASSPPHSMTPYPLRIALSSSFDAILQSEFDALLARELDRIAPREG